MLADAGVDLIALEMLEETTHAPLAMRAAKETGLPIWLGISCRRDGNRIVRFTDHSPQVSLADSLDALLPLAPDVVNIMHSEIEAISDALAVVQTRWSGPVGVYPESGYFAKPNWNFTDVISPNDLVREALGWVDAGAQLLGGCCGTTPAHIHALRSAVDDRDVDG